MKPEDIAQLEYEWFFGAKAFECDELEVLEDEDDDEFGLFGDRFSGQN